MPEELQQLLTRINDDYLKQAEKEKNNTLGAAKVEAEAIVSAAREEAGKILEKARAESDMLRHRHDEDIKRASRNSIRDLRAEFLRLLTAAVGKSAAEAMTPAFMADMVRQMAEAAPQGAAHEAMILTNSRNIEALRNLLPGTLHAEIKAGEFKGGLQVSLDASGEYFDFSDAAVSNFFREHLSRELNKLLDAES